MEGIRNGKEEKVVTGEAAAHISMAVEGLRQYVRGQESLAKSKDAKTIVSGILGEINRIVPKPDVGA